MPETLKISVMWTLTIDRESAGRLVTAAVERCLGSPDDAGWKELIARLMIDGGSDTIESIAQDPANTIIKREILPSN